jgi:hypothetical protein
MRALYWLCLLCAGVALGYGIGLAFFRHPKPAEPDWPAIASCVWDRWDAGADMTPVVRFCYRFGPEIYGMHEVTP